MARGIFVTGTDTGVGKTVVTAALAAALHARGTRVGVMKPAESGCPGVNGMLQPQDALLLQRTSGCSAPLDVINPYRLAEPLTPALAAERAGVTIELGHIEACYRRLAEEHDIVLVEGAGGLLSPLSAEHTMLDLAGRLELEVLIVAANVLGVINHTRLTVTALWQAGVTITGIVLNTIGETGDAATETNAEALRRWAGAPLLATLPRIDPTDGKALLQLGTSHLVCTI